MRNFLSGETLERIYLNSFPTTLNYNSKVKKLLVGHDGKRFLYIKVMFIDGYVTIVKLKRDKTERYKSYLDGAIVAIERSKKSKNIVLFHNSGFCSYKY